MARYTDIQEWLRRTQAVTVKTCWIAHVKVMCGLPTRVAFNRKSRRFRANPCPPNKVHLIKKAFRHFGII